MPCLKAFVSKALGYGIIAGAVGGKIGKIKSYRLQALCVPRVIACALLVIFGLSRDPKLLSLPLIAIRKNRLSYPVINQS